MRTFLGKSDFYWPLMVLGKQWQCPLYANVLSIQSSVPTMFLHFLANGRVTKGRVPPLLGAMQCFLLQKMLARLPRAEPRSEFYLCKFGTVKNF